MVERKGMHRIVSHLILILGCGLVLLPIYIALVAASHEASELIGNTPLWFGGRMIENVSSVLGHGLQAAGGAPVWRMLVNSLIMALGIAAGKIVISLTAAFAIVYFKFPGRGICFFLIFVTLMLPVEVRIVPTFEVATNLGLIDNYMGLILPLIASATATFLYRQFFLTIPEELLEAARIDGCGAVRTYFYIYLPLSKTILATLTIFKTVSTWNDFFYPLIMTQSEKMKTVQLALQMFKGSTSTHYNWLMAATLITVLPMIIVYFCAQKYFVQGVVASGMKN